MAYSQSRQDSSGTLKTTISLGRTPAIVHSGPFYLMKEPPEQSELTGTTNLIAHNRLGNTYMKLLGKKKNELGSFLHNMTDVILSRTEPGSMLKSLSEGRIIKRDILPLNPTQLIAFRLQPGPMPPQYRIFNQIVHKKHKKHKKKQRNQLHESHPLTDGAGPSDVISDPLVTERKKKDKKKDKKRDKKDKKEKKRKIGIETRKDDMDV